MEKTSKELLREFVNSQKFTSTTDIFNAKKELFNIVCISCGDTKDNIYDEYH